MSTQTATGGSSSVLAAMAPAMIVAVVWLALPMLDDRAPDNSDLLLGLLAASTLGFVLFAVGRGALDLLSPLPTIGGFYFLYFVNRGLFLRYGDLTLSQLAPSLLGYYDSMLEPALEFTLQGWIAAVVGYLTPIGSTVAAAMPKPAVLSRGVSASRTTALWVIGMAARLWAVSRGTHLMFARPDNVDLGVQGVIEYASKLVPITYLLMLSLHYRGELKGTLAKVPFYVMLPMEIAWGVITTSRFQTVFPFILILIARHDWKERIRLTNVAVLFLVLTFVVLPLGGQFRHSLGEMGGNDVTTFDANRSAAAAAEARDSVGVMIDDGNYVARQLGAISSRLHGVDSVMVALHSVPAILPWESTDLYLMLPAMALVPRFVWPTKPEMIPVVEFNYRYWGLPRSDPTSVAVQNLGSLYVAFGWWGAILGMFVLGLLWRVIHDYFRLRTGALGTVVYVNLLLVITSVENDVPGVYSQLIKMVVILLSIAWLVSTGEATKRVSGMPDDSRAGQPPAGAGEQSADEGPLGGAQPRR